MKQPSTLEDLLMDQQVRIEHLENMVHQLGEHMNAQNHLIHVLARQLAMVADEADVNINMRYN